MSQPQSVQGHGVDDIIAGDDVAWGENPAIIRVILSCWKVDYPLNERGRLSKQRNIIGDTLLNEFNTLSNAYLH